MLGPRPQVDQEHLLANQDTARPVCDIAPAYALETVAGVTGVVIVGLLATLAVCLILAERQGCDRYSRDTRRCQSSNHHDHLGCEITSIRYGSPLSTVLTPRSSAAWSSLGSLIGPSLFMPYPAAIFA